MKPLKNHGGSPEIPIDDKLRGMVTRMAEAGLTQEEVATVLGISETTLQRRLAAAFKAGIPSADAEVKRSLFWMATKGKTPGAAIFWLKARCGWSERLKLDVTFGPLVDRLVSGLIDLLHRAIPDFCPHCRTALNLKPEITRLLVDESKKLSGEAATVAAAHVAQREQEPAE